MRIVIDLQSVQEQKYKKRGIGRYSLALTRAMLQRCRGHQVYLLLNGAFPDSIDELRFELADLLPSDSVKVWHGISDTAAIDPANQWRRHASEVIREDYVAHLRPDLLLITNLFQGIVDATVVSINRHRNDVTTACLFYDLIPLIYPDQYLRDRSLKTWYYERIDHLRRADLVLAISESSKQEAIEWGKFQNGEVVNISSAIDPEIFCPASARSAEDDDVLARLGATGRFVLYTGAEDERKNLHGFIRGFALLPPDVVADLQAVIACLLPSALRVELTKLALDCGLSAGTLVLTGYVSDDDLLTLYRRCELFVFPSWHEGFGLPALEAMACGAPTIGSNRSSLPEVIGRADALFDPYDDTDIARVMAKALGDGKFRAALRRHAVKQAARFSWEQCADRAWDAIEQVVAAKSRSTVTSEVSLSRPRLAFVSPLPPEHTGIADYSAKLLPMLAKYYDIDVVVTQGQTQELAQASAHVRVQGVAWFERHAATFDRIIYQFGNSPFHAHMLALSARFPGIVVLHDFYLSALIVNTDERGQTGLLGRTLHRSHGWSALHPPRDGWALADIYPCNLAILEDALGVIVHSEYCKVLARQWYGEGSGDDWVVIPLLQSPAVASKRARARVELGLDANRFLVCTFGGIDGRKYNLEVISAWLQSSLAANPDCELVMVGEVPDSPYGTALRRMQLDSRAGGRVRFAGRVDHETYSRYLAAADMAVQLRRLSRGETSAAVLDCMNYGVPTIVNANGSMAELPSEACLMLPDDFSISALSQAMSDLHAAPAQRKRLGRAAAEYIARNYHPRRCAELYAQAVEGFVRRAKDGATGLIDRASRFGLPRDGRDVPRLAERAAQVAGLRVDRRRQLLVDVSAIAAHDLKTGIQRVVRSILLELLKTPPAGFRVEPVYAAGNDGYRYAARFTAALLGAAPQAFNDEPLAVVSGDIYLCLDSHPGNSIERQNWLDEIRLLGVSTYFYVYDLLPVLRPEFFPDYMRLTFSRWLEVVGRADGAVCISQHVATTVAQWLDMYGSGRRREYKVGWAHLGADIDLVVKPAVGRPAIEATFAGRPSFLMVGTIEPRKGHLQVVAAFDLLWGQGIDVNLVLVGKRGFDSALCERLDRHPECERRLFWLEHTDDHGLERAYSASTCLIMASADEGFGLPLIEAARHGLPILARDIPIFREVADEHAFYFQGDAPQDLARAIRSWMALDAEGRAPASGQIGWLTWRQSTQQLLDIILNDKWQTRWTPEPEPDLVSRMRGADHRVKSQVGEWRDGGVRSTGVAGPLIFGPYLRMQQGRYVARLYGSIGPGGAGLATADVSGVMGQQTWATAELALADPAQPALLAVLPFELDAEVFDLECRVIVTEFSDVRIDLIEIWKGRGNVLPATATATEPPRGIDYTRSKRGFRLWATHPMLGSVVGNRVDRAIWTNAEPGYLLYGPYLPVRAGWYRATIFGSVNNPSTLGESIVDCVASPKPEAIAVKRIADQEPTPGTLVEVEFVLQDFTNQFEVRVWADKGADFQVKGVELRPIDRTEVFPSADHPANEGVIAFAGGDL